MKKHIILSVAVLALAAAACTTQDDIYKEYVVAGGRIYPAKAVNVETVAGFQRVTISWEKPKDPSVVVSRLFWNSRADSVEVAYDAQGKASHTVTGLEDRSYTFYIVNYDKNQNKSLDYEVTANPYGSNWLVSHSERTVNGTYHDDGDSTVLVFTKATYEMVSTRVAYMNTAGKVVEYPKPLLPGTDTIVLYDAMKGKKILMKSTFKPDKGTDAVENISWSKSTHGIVYKLDVSGWTVTATDNQVQGTNTPDKIFDGITNSGAARYVSNNATAYRGIFPKILAIDSHSAAGKEPTVFRLDFYQHPIDGSYRFIRDMYLFIGNKAYDPNTAAYATDYDGLVMKRTFSTTEICQKISLNKTGRYIALVFTNTYNTDASFIDLWELVPFGYIEGDSDVPNPDFK